MAIALSSTQAQSESTRYDNIDMFYIYSECKQMIYD